MRYDGSNVFVLIFRSREATSVPICSTFAHNHTLKMRKSSKFNIFINTLLSARSMLIIMILLRAAHQLSLDKKYTSYRIQKKKRKTTRMKVGHRGGNNNNIFLISMIRFPKL